MNNVENFWLSNENNDFLDTSNDGVYTTKEPKFGIMSYEIVSPNVLKVCFLNGRTYFSRWENGGTATGMKDDYKDDFDYRPLEELNMECLAAKMLCHSFFDPNFQKSS